jgi:hypothetical protein
MPKDYLPELVVPGGRNGDGVTAIRTKPNSFVRGGGAHVFETDRDGKVIRDIDPNRVKARERHRNQVGQVFEKMEKIGPPTADDLEILRRMGVLK